MRVFCIIVLWLLSPVLAQGETLRICNTDWPPYASLKDGRIQGITVDILEEAARRSGDQFIFTQMPWKRCLLKVKENEFHAAADSTNRPGYLYGPTVTAVFAQNAWVRVNSRLQSYNGLETLEEKQVGLVSGYVYPDYITKNERISVDYVNLDETNLKKLAMGRVDMAISDLVNSQVIADRFGLEIRPLVPVVSVNLLYPVFGPAFPDQQARIDQALASMQQDGTMDRIYLRHLNISFTELRKLATPYSP